MISRVWSLLGVLAEAGLSAAEDAAAVLSGLRQAPSRRRVRLAVNILRGRPTAYRVDGVRPLGGQGVMYDECTLVPSALDICAALPSRAWSFGDSNADYCGLGHSRSTVTGGVRPSLGVQDTPPAAGELGR